MLGVPAQQQQWTFPSSNFEKIALCLHLSMPWPGIEPGFQRPQRCVLTIRRSRLWEVLLNSEKISYFKTNIMFDFPNIDCVSQYYSNLNISTTWKGGRRYILFYVDFDNIQSKWDWLQHNMKMNESWRNHFQFDGEGSILWI